MEAIDLLKQEHFSRWNIINDGVMGGRSSSHLSEHISETQSYSLQFIGNVSLENNGGFASTTCAITDDARQTLVEHEATKIVISTLGDGKKYQLRLKTNNGAITYKTLFDTEKGEVQHWSFTPQQFIETFRGQDFPNRDKPEFANLSDIGFLISNKQSGQFKLQILSLSIQ
ncbi:CIA30 family protein [Shewanella psychrotolerans]|uniref:CIA30 family protein n=1 Tax=Shewanella psychrotolerans TaxID=2864206 RepID=UPI001C65C71E|nr:CIA30 family protein [Shewanella psychrotolerans]QYK02881.1 CIA30 family protein [Shewanella psychrotolerans]